MLNVHKQASLAKRKKKLEKRSAKKKIKDEKRQVQKKLKEEQKPKKATGKKQGQHTKRGHSPAVEQEQRKKFTPNEGLRPNQNRIRNLEPYLKPVQKLDAEHSGKPESAVKTTHRANSKQVRTEPLASGRR